MLIFKLIYFSVLFIIRLIKRQQWKVKQTILIRKYNIINIEYIIKSKNLYTLQDKKNV